VTARCAVAAGPEDAAGGWTIASFDRVSSTMDEARRLAVEGAPDRTVVRADVQTGGRGRLGRPWVSSIGNVYTTAILRPAISTARAAELSLVAAVAVADTVARFSESVRLKWPNDVLLNGGKVSGVLLEAVAEGVSLSAVLVGIGVNVGSHPDLPDRPTSRIETADADTVFAALLDAFDQRYRQWSQHGLGGIRFAWLERGPDLGIPMIVGLGADRVRGTFAGLEPDGSLRLELADGSVRQISSGEVLG
jgi:BirA family transcriptional regulator, biotin operon repressor / biotin---[acetyl-CoA-carboxylase] ligase